MGKAIKGLEEELSKLPEAQREEARGAMLDAFKDFDPKNPPGKRVAMLTRDQKMCPRCGGLLMIDECTLTLPGGTVVQPAECDPCDQPYFLEAAN